MEINYKKIINVVDVYIAKKYPKYDVMQWKDRCECLEIELLAMCKFAEIQKEEVEIYKKYSNELQILCNKYIDSI